MPRRPEVPATIEFGRFKVVRHRRELLADGRPVELGGRAFDTLMALIDAHGMVLDKDQLMSLVWPDRVVEENNLAAQIAVLRKVFGADRHLIRTVAGRGYQFTGDIHTAAAAAPSPPSRMTNLPEAVSELIGREAELEEVAALVTEHRLVSLVGAGGIGKTRLGLEVARHLLPRFPDGVFVAELGPLSSPELVPATVASALGLTHIAGTASREGVAGAVGAKKLLLVIDNCEHVIAAATGMAEALLRASPGVTLLATSREPLRVSGEYMYRVPSLDVPAEDNQDMDDVFRYGAVRLFVSRAHAAEPRYVAEGRVAAATAAICRRLDGIPLAIELAATRVAALGIGGVAARLDDRFRLLTGGSRMALARHQTLRATLDWSYDLLAEAERVVLRRLGVFVGAFTLDAASAVAAGVDIPASEVADSVANLVGRSLVSTDIGGAIVYYRLLETTRVYAREKLAGSGELGLVSRRHAEHYLRLLGRDAAADTAPTLEWLDRSGASIDNIRAALGWAFSADGDTSIGRALTVAFVPVWMHLSLIEECREQVERALFQADSVDNSNSIMRLYAALGTSLMQTKGPVPEIRSAWTTVLEIAQRLGDTEHQLRAYWGLCAYQFNAGEFANSLAVAQRLR